MNKYSRAVAILSFAFGVMCGPAALADISSQLQTCGNGSASYVNILVPKIEDHHKRKLVSSVSSPAGEGYNTSQAGIFVTGITGGVTTTVGISYKVKPL